MAEPILRQQSTDKLQTVIACTWVTGIYSVHNLKSRPGEQSQYSDSLQAQWSGDQILVGVIFSAPNQTGPGVHPASYAMGTRSFLGVRWPGRGVDHPPLSSAEVKERVELYLYSRPGPSWSVLG